MLKVVLWFQLPKCVIWLNTLNVFSEKNSNIWKGFKDHDDYWKEWSGFEQCNSSQAQIERRRKCLFENICTGLQLENTTCEGN
jgi:hypothetical protein